MFNIFNKRFLYYINLYIITILIYIIKYIYKQ